MPRKRQPATPAPSGLCECGCGRVTSVATRTYSEKGVFKGRPLRFLRGHSGHKRQHPGYEIDQSTGCWNWLGHIDDKGYAGHVAGIQGKPVSAYRAYYESVHGPVAEGLVIDHKCRNPRCVNPEHLEAVPQSVNVQRGAAAKLTVDQILEIRASRLDIAALASAYGVSRRCIRKVLAGESWRAA